MRHALQAQIRGAGVDFPDTFRTGLPATTKHRLQGIDLHKFSASGTMDAYSKIVLAAG
jgi:hypothetical protein